MQTTLNQIRAHGPCKRGWAKLLRQLGKTRADDAPLSILTVLDSNGLDDALWCLRAVKGHDREIRLYAVWCARQVQYLMTDPRSINAVDVAERYASGQATDKELATAGAAAEAAWTATEAAAAGAATAAWTATEAAAGIAAEATAEAAALASSWARASPWARDDAEAAARAKQDAKLRQMCAECDTELAAGHGMGTHDIDLALTKKPLALAA